MAETICDCRLPGPKAETRRPYVGILHGRLRGVGSGRDGLRPVLLDPTESPGRPAANASDGHVGIHARFCRRCSTNEPGPKGYSNVLPTNCRKGMSCINKCAQDLFAPNSEMLCKEA